MKTTDVKISSKSTKFFLPLISYHRFDRTQWTPENSQGHCQDFSSSSPLLLLFHLLSVYLSLFPSLLPSPPPPTCPTSFFLIHLSVRRPDFRGKGRESQGGKELLKRKQTSFYQVWGFFSFQVCTNTTTITVKTAFLQRRRLGGTRRKMTRMLACLGKLGNF